MKAKNLSFSLISLTDEKGKGLIWVNILVQPNHMPSESTVTSVLSGVGYKDVKVNISYDAIGCVVWATTSSSSKSRHSSYRVLSSMAGFMASLAIYIPLAAKLIESTCPSPVCERFINTLPLAVLTCGSLYLDYREQHILQAAALSSAPVYLLYTGISLTKASIFNNKAICTAAIGVSIVMGYVFHKHENSDEELVFAATR